MHLLFMPTYMKVQSSESMLSSTSYNNNDQEVNIRRHEDPPGATCTPLIRQRKKEEKTFDTQLAAQDGGKCKSNKQSERRNVVVRILCCISAVVVMAIYHSNNKGGLLLHNMAMDDAVSSSSYDGSQTNSTNFTWDMINVTKPGVCGNTKCFMFSKEYNPSFEIAYAVSEYHPKRMRWVWDQAQLLKDKYGANHIYLEPAEKIRLSRDLWYIMDGLKDRNLEKEVMHQDLHLEDFIHFAEVKREGKDNRKTASIQKLQVIPKPFIEIGHGEDRRQDEVKRQWKSFVESITNTTKFKETLLKENKKLEKTMKKEVWLKSHFQILIDNQGRIFHFDLDRAFKHKSNSELKELKRKDMSIYYKCINDMAIKLKMPKW